MDTIFCVFGDPGERGGRRVEREGRGRGGRRGEKKEGRAIPLVVLGLEGVGLLPVFFWVPERGSEQYLLSEY